MKCQLKAEEERYLTRMVAGRQTNRSLSQLRSRSVFTVEAVESGERTGCFKNNETSRPKTNAFYDQFKPMIIILTVFGRLALRRSPNGEYKWKYFSWLGFYCLVNYSVQTYLAVQICMKRVKAVLDSSDYDEFIFAMHILAYIQIHFHVPFSYWLQGPKCAEYMNQWCSFQDKWQHVTGEKLHLKHKKVAMCYVLIVLPFIALVLVMEKYSTLHDPFELLLPHFFIIGSTACVLGTWYMTCLDIAIISKKLSQLLVKRLHTNPDPHFLQKWRILWLDLGSLVSDLGNNHFAIMVSILLTFSLTFLLGLYNALSKIILGDFGLKTIGYLTASSMSLLIIYVVCDSGHQATTQVESFTSQCILRSHLPATHDEVKYEVDLILRVVQTDPPQIQLAGFVTLNRPLFISFVANTITYLIVILQFKR